MTRTIVIGDIHGCIEELSDLVKQCDVGKSDGLVSVGDLVGKGPDSAGVVAFAREHGMGTVRGNHDQHFLNGWQALKLGKAMPWDNPEREAQCKALSATDWEYLEALPYWLRIPEHDVIIVHAGFVPSIPLESQDKNHMMTMRSLLPDGRPSKRIEGVPWASKWPGPEHVLFGHDALRKLQQYPHATGLDTGCVYGGMLTAVILPDRELVQVKAKREWCARGEPP